jgi:hypothetical protein
LQEKIVSIRNISLVREKREEEREFFRGGLK